MSRNKQSDAVLLGSIYGNILDKVQVVEAKQEIGDSALIDGGPEKADGWQDDIIEPGEKGENRYDASKFSSMPEEDAEGFSDAELGRTGGNLRPSKSNGASSFEKENGGYGYGAKDQRQRSRDNQASANRGKLQRSADADARHKKQIKKALQDAGVGYTKEAYAQLMKVLKGKGFANDETLASIAAQYGEKKLTESVKVGQNEVNKFMANKKSIFDKLYENVMFGDEAPDAEADELDALGLGDDEGLEGEAEGITLTVPQDIAQQLFDLLTAAGVGEVGGEEALDGLEGGEEESGFGDFEEDEEAFATKLGDTYDDGKQNKAKAPGYDATTGNAKKTTVDIDSSGDLKKGKDSYNDGKSNKVGTLGKGQDYFNQ